MNLKFKISNLKLNSGQSLVEVLIAVSIGALIIGAAVSSISLTLKSDVKNTSSAFAVPLARDTLDKTRSISEGGWANVYNQPKNTNLYIVNDNGLNIVSGTEGIVGDDITNGLVGYWKLDEASGTTAYDTTANDNKGALVNSPSPTGVASCKVGGCLSFNGTNNYVEVADAASLKPTSITVSAWVNLTSQATRHLIATKWIGYTLEVTSNGYPYFQIWNGSQVGSISTIPITFGSWSFITGTYDDSTKTIKTYVNGTEGASLVVSSGISYNTNTFRISDCRYNCASGLIDDVRIYGRALSPAEILQLYRSRIYTRALTMQNICRDVSGNITGLTDANPATNPADGTTTACTVSGGKEDSSTQKSTAIVGLPDSAPISIAEYFTRIKNSVTRVTNWTDPSSYSSQSQIDTNTPGQIKLFQ